MKTIYSKISVLGLIILSLILMPILPASAVGNTSGNGNESAICNRLTNTKSSYETRIASHITNIQANFSERLTEITENKATVDQKVKTLRERVRTQFEARIQEMLSQEDLTDTQTQAINTFRTNMEQAEEIRETAIDDAREEYHSALAAAVTGHQQTLITVGETYKTSVLQAFETAISSCSENASTAITTLKSSLRTAREALINTRREAKIGQDIKELASTRNAAIKLANEAFVKAANEYSETLTTALEK